MKKTLITLACAFTSMFCMAQQQQDSLTWQPQFDWDYYYPCDETYVEFGIGGLLPTDESNNFFALDFEFGKYIDNHFGIGLNLKVGQESEYKDKLNYIGPKFRFRINYDPLNVLDLDLHIGFGYGWYKYNDGTYYDPWYYTMSYIVPNIGMTGYVNINKNVSLGFEPSYMWYISTDKEDSDNVGVWNLMGKVKIRF